MTGLEMVKAVLVEQQRLSGCELTRANSRGEYVKYR